MDHFHLQNRNALTHAIRTAVSLGIVDALSEKQMTVPELAEKLALNPGALQLLMDLLCETELIEKYGDDYALSAVARLIPKQLYDFGDYYWNQLGDFVRSGESLPIASEIDATDQDFLGDNLVPGQMAEDTGCNGCRTNPGFWTLKEKQSGFSRSVLRAVCSASPSSIAIPTRD